MMSIINMQKIYQYTFISSEFTKQIFSNRKTQEFYSNSYFNVIFMQRNSSTNENFELSRQFL